jgi:argininosuccinate synthase
MYLGRPNRPKLLFSAYTLESPFADLGQGEELEPAREKAELLGIKPNNIYIEDLREEFVRDFVFPMFRCNAL